MSTIELYKDKINSMSNYIEQAKSAVSDFCVDLSALKSKILGINSSVCDNVVSSISSSSQTQEQQIAGLEATQKQVTFIDLTINRDNAASAAVSKAKDDFYKEYSYLKPDSEKSGWEKFCDGLKKVGDWCKEHWKEICLVLEIVAAVVCLLIPGLEGIGIGILTGMLIGGLSGAAIGGISGYAQYGVDGILSRIINGTEDGMLLGGLFGGLGGIGAIAGEAFGCSALMTNMFSISSKLGLGMMAFDMTALANDFQNRFFKIQGLVLELLIRVSVDSYQI